MNVTVCLKEVMRVGAISVAHKPAVTETFESEVRVIYQLDSIFVYFSSTCFGLTRPSSGAIEFIISFTNAAYGAARCRS